MFSNPESVRIPRGHRAAGKGSSDDVLERIIKINRKAVAYHIPDDKLISLVLSRMDSTFTHKLFTISLH
jgi:hypothetical protein